MDTLNTSLLVIGAGPGGYVCAIRAGQLGINTIIVEAEKPGGTCLNVGCIPSKALIHAADEYHKVNSFCNAQDASSAMGISAKSAAIEFSKTIDWKNGIVHRLTGGVSGLLKKANVQVLQGTARFRDGKTVIVDGGDGEIQVNCEHVVIATGSEPVQIPTLPFSEQILSSTGALALTEIPKTLAVVGGGYIGLELGTCFAKLGSKVNIIESADRLLPQYDEQLTKPVVERLKQLGVNVHTHTNAMSYDSDKLVLRIDGSDTDSETNIDSETNTNSGNNASSETNTKSGSNASSEPNTKSGSNASSEPNTKVSEIQADIVLVTVGRRARLSGWGLDELSLTVENGFIKIDEHCQTSMRGVYAIGDVSGEPMLAHRAMAQGDMVARILAGQKQSWDKQCIPAVCFTDPEIVTAGLSPDEAKAAGETFEVSQFPFQANGRAMSLQREDGFIRVVTQKGSNVILGLQAVGAGVSELSVAFSIAIEMGACAEDIAATVHAHPTMSEGLQEACLASIGYGLHL